MFDKKCLNVWAGPNNLLNIARFVLSLVEIAILNLKLQASKLLEK